MQISKYNLEQLQLHTYSPYIYIIFVVLKLVFILEEYRTGSASVWSALGRGAL